MTTHYSLVRSNNGASYFGGEPVGGFSIPQNNCPGSFQYLGMLSRDDPAFSWLPFDLHLICPVYMNLDKIWLDYADPERPTIINLDEINQLDTAYDDLRPGSIVAYERVRFEAAPPDTSIPGRVGLAGAPRWIQNQETPICPKTKAELKFLCQIEYSLESKIKVAYTNVVNEDEWYKHYFETMNFWGDGDLYVFFEPESKVACYFIQNT